MELLGNIVGLVFFLLCGYAFLLFLIDVWGSRKG